MSKKILSIIISVVMLFGMLSMVSVNAEETSTKDETATQSQESYEVYCDLDGDGEITIKDTTLLQKALAGKADIDESIADADSNGKVEIKDAAVIQKYVTHKINTFPGLADHDWRTSSIGYEIFIRSFYDSDGDGCGDFRGIAEKVDYLKSLNVGMVWLMPFNKTDSYHGYDVIDYKSLAADYGTMEDFQYMLDTLHENGIKVIMDLVVNHTSDECDWFTKSKKNEDNYRDFYVWAQSRPFSQSGNWNRVSSADNLYYYYCFNWKMPDLNYKNQDVWAAVDDVADYWIDNGIDGFRLDAAYHIDDTLVGNNTHSDSNEDSVTHLWWQHFENHVKAKKPDSICIGEVWPSTSLQTIQQKFYADFDSDFDFQIKDEILGLANGSSKYPARILNSYYQGMLKYANTTPDVKKLTINSIMLSNHDVNRAAYVIEQKSGKETLNARIKLAASTMLTLPGIPWIYYGDEIGQSGGGTDGSSDPNRREAMDWYKGKTGTGMTRMNALRSWTGSEKFTKANDGISVEEQSGVDGSVLEHYRKLTEIRNKYKIFFTGSCSTTHYLGNISGYSVTDENRDYSMFVIHNNRNTAYTYKAAVDFTDELTGDTYKSGDTVTVAPLTSMIVRYTDTVPLVEE
ncbi:MAG: hypothetical protein J1F17_04440 [Oscillospiraceae bacterium]|nr:hypothetical protein [Oscillospiraceae bacterium]